MKFGYTPDYQSFLSSMKGYRKLVRMLAIARFLRLYVLPVFGLAAFALWILVRWFGPGDRGGTFAVIAACGVILGLIGPFSHAWGMRRLYRLRAALAPDGQYAEFDESQICFVVPNKAEVKYQWSAFTHTFEDARALTLYSGASAFHTIPKKGLQDEVLSALHKSLHNTKKLNAY